MTIAPLPPPMIARTERADLLARRFGPGLIALAAAAVLVWTWRTWPDPLVDFGQQLYVSWRIVEGQVLYRDVAYHYGPLSPYLNAALFRSFGTSLTTLIVANLLVVAGVIVVLHRLLCGIASHAAATLGCLTFVFVLLAKILFNVRTFHYGFALAMPATVVTVVALFEWLPARIERAGGYGAVVRAAVLGAWAVFVVGHLGITAYWFDEKTEIVASGADAFHADWRGDYVNTVLDEIEVFVGEDETLAVMPAGVMINYLARRPNPTPFIYFMPSDIVLYGEDPIVGALEASPPDFVLLVHEDTSEFGYRFLGRDYGMFIGLWIRENYEEVSLLGEPPFVEGNFGMRLMRRTTPVAP